VASPNHGIAVNRDEPDVAVVALRGEHDQYSSRAISETIADELEAGRSVVVDLSETAFLDSTCAGALLVADQRATTSGLRLVVALTDDTPTPVVRLFHTARLGTILRVEPSLAGALTLARQAAEQL
jgi:anti-anti-sigma factor